MDKHDLYFDPVDLKMDFPLMENRILNRWIEKRIIEKYLIKNIGSEKIFSFLDGPITANNKMGVHHAWGRAYKDLWQRYKNMQGFRQRFQNGFDCQGLWVEVEVEKELGIKSKKDIENLVPGDKKASIELFVNKCKERVKKYSDIQTEQSKRLGYFMDWDNSYFTLSENNNYMIWRFLKVCSDNGWIYKGNDVVPWCYRCETAISQHEILTEDYKDVIHDSIFLKLPIKERKNEYLLIWTTTPWTIPANTAVAVDTNLDYVLVEVKKDELLWLGKDTVERVLGKDCGRIAKTEKGIKLVGLGYDSPFDNLPVVKKALKENINMHKVIATDSLIMPITTEEGTGLVHTSTSTGEEDHKLGKKIGLPVIPAIDDVAKYLDEYGVLTGKNAKKHPELIFDYIKDYETTGISYLFKILPYKHRYPVCWRCKTELVWKLTDEWYIAMDRKMDNNKNTLRERMIEVAKSIKWIPGFGLERELDWLKNMHDWLISKKNRYWGLALPIWECTSCGNFEVIGSYDELKEKTVSGWSNFEGKTPHKPQIDEILIKCAKCSELSKRIEPVGNPWLDAGIVAFSTISKENKATLFQDSSEKPLYTSDTEEWKKWFPADFITESFPGQFKNWFYSLIAMSSVLESKKPFKIVLGYATALDEKGNTMHKSTGNMIEFNEGAEKIGVDVMRWMFFKQNPSENLLFGYNIADEVRRRFHLKLWNVYNFFTTYANIDNWKPVAGKETFSSENILDIWIDLRLKELVFSVTCGLDRYDAFSAASEIEKFVDDLSNWFIRRSRERVGPAADSIKDKEMFYLTCQKVLVTLSKILSPFTPFMADEIFRNLTKDATVNLVNWPEVPDALKPEENDILKKMENARELVEKIHAKRKEERIFVKQPLLSVDVSGSNETDFSPEMIMIVKDELNVKNINFVKGKDVIILDTTLTPELKEEMDTRDLIRQIQEERKNMGLGLSDKTLVTSAWLPRKPELVDRLKRKTMSSTIKVGSKLEVVIDK